MSSPPVRSPQSPPLPAAGCRRELHPVGMACRIVHPSSCLKAIGSHVGLVLRGLTRRPRSAGRPADERCLCAAELSPPVRVLGTSSMPPARR